MYELLNAPYIRWLDSLTYGTKMPRLSPSQVSGSFVCQPPFDEQRTIASFLDRETARIDALVAKKQRLIELLQEQRTALVTRAVTKGVDPTVPNEGFWSGMGGGDSGALGGEEGKATLSCPPWSISTANR